MLRIHDGEIAEAEHDLLACHRLARLVGSGPFLIHGMLQRDIEFKACLADAALLQYGKLTAADAIAYRTELQKLPPIESAAHQLGHGERFMILGFATELAQRQQPELEELLLPIAPVGATEFFMAALTEAMKIIWDEGMRTLNKEWDRWVAAVATPITSGRQARFEKLEKEARPILDVNPDAVNDAPLEERGEWLGKMLAVRMMPALKERIAIEDRLRMHVDLVQLGFAIAAYHADSGAYPPTLEALVPKYCSSLPTDRFTAKPLVYRLHQGGYGLSSAGDNGVDDGSRDSKQWGDDIVIWIGDPTPPSHLIDNVLWVFAAMALVAAILCVLTIAGLRRMRRRRLALDRL